MTSSERPATISKKKRCPQPYKGGENSGNALEVSNALNYRVWGIPFEGNSRKRSESIFGIFLDFFRNFFRKSQPYWGHGP